MGDIYLDDTGLLNVVHRRRRVHEQDLMDDDLEDMVRRPNFTTMSIIYWLLEIIHRGQYHLLASVLQCLIFATPFSIFLL